MKRTFPIILTLIFFTMFTHAQSMQEVTVSNGQTTFSLFAPQKAKSVKVRIYNEGQAKKATKVIPLKYDAGRWVATVSQNLTGKYYTFQVNNMKECPGIFAKAVAVNGRRAYIADMASTNPEGWDTDRHPVVEKAVDHVLYELHFRDFSIDQSSKLQYKGKFLALTEPHAIEHLKTLGVNAVHILPSFDFGSIDETTLEKNQYNWGYDPMNYNVPEGSYSTDPYTPEARIREFKQMVKAMHDAGIRVILDVVYNHTYNINESNFTLTYPDYFYRHKEDGTPNDGSGCGNETASEQPMMRQYMIESCRYWVDEYHIDGFRFDLMGIHDIETMNLIRKELDKVDPTLIIYGEGWSAGTCAYPNEKLGMKANTYQMPGIAAFSDDIRDALRGPFYDDHKAAFLGGEAGHEESIKYGVVGAIAHPQVDMSKVNYSKQPFAKQPGQMISYVSCHDDMCLVDRLTASIPSLQDAKDKTLLIRLDLLAQTAVLTSQGVPFILSGEEMLRTKLGVHNSYNSPDSINHLDWNNLERYPMVFRYYRNLIAMRKNHPAFRLGDADLVRRHLEFLQTPSCVVGWQLKDLRGIDTWSDIVVLLNSNKDKVECDIPEGWWTVVCRNSKINEGGMGTIHGGKVTVPAHSAMILHK